MTTRRLFSAPAEAGGPLPDQLTLACISALAYVLAVALHEHLGHSAACFLLGSRPIELGAFYVNCDDTRLSSLGLRLVALAGPAMSLGTGLLCFQVIRLRPRLSPAAWYFWWLLGSIDLMEAAGYLLFSGVSGLGDLGTTRDGALFGQQPPWLWRVALIGLGVVSYRRVVRWALQVIDPHVSGQGVARIRGARRIALTSYVVGAAVYLVIGTLNPYGLTIVAVSVLPSSMGGTAGLLFMMQRLDRQRDVSGSGLYFGRRWRWIGAGIAATVLYALVLGPTLRV